MKNTPILEIKNLEKYFSRNTNLINGLFRRGSTNEIQAVDDVSLSLYKDESQGIIGESGCGKSTLLMTLMGLTEPTGGQILFKGEDVSDYDRNNWKKFRSDVQMIFQDPFNSLNPKMSVKETLSEPLKIHGMDNQRERIEQSLEQAELRPAEKYLDRFPNQLSGGEKQRVSIARALVVNPDIILADEPVSMLDVSTQASVLQLLSDLGEDLGVSMLYVSHDLSTVSYVCEKVNVMYLGRIIESAKTGDILRKPKHPYSQALIDAVPIPDPNHNRERTRLEGAALEPVGLGDGCRFRDRCPERMQICEKKPDFVNIEKDRNVACHLYYDHKDQSPRE